MPHFDGPNMCYWDIETGMGKVEYYTYDLKQYSNYINPKHVTSPVWISCAAWKFQGSNVVSSTSVLNDPERFKKCYHDDYHVVKVLHELVESVDILVAHNGDRFDWKMFAGRCLFHGLPPPKRPRMIDTLKICRKEFKIMSNSLRFAADFLGVAQKDESPDWELIARGDAREIKNAERYCRQDIRALEGVYLKIRPWDKNHPNHNAYLSGVHHLTCKTCGSDNLKKNGHKYTQAGKYQEYGCLDCGAHTVDRKNLKVVGGR